MKIERALEADWPDILALIRANPGTLEQDELPRVDEFFVARDDERVPPMVAGCAALVVYERRLAELRSLAVREEFQGNGIGNLLIRACLDEADRLKVKQTLTITGRPASFEREGFGLNSGAKFALVRRFPEQKD